MSGLVDRKRKAQIYSLNREKRAAKDLAWNMQGICEYSDVLFAEWPDSSHPG